MLAYRIPDVAPAAAKGLMHSGEHAALARLALAGPWQFTPHPEGGTLATWKDTAVPRLEALGEAVPTDDGMTYYRPARLPSQMALAKTAHNQNEIDVDLACGIRVSILLATSAPRRLRFTSGDPVGDPVGEYGLLAFAVQRRTAEADDSRPVTVGDDDVRRLLFLAIAQRYRVTEELLNDLGWLSTADVDPLLCAIWGSDPKACAVASGT